MATTLNFYKVTALPGTLEANAVYAVPVSGNPNLVELFIVNSTGSAARHVLGEADVASMIASAMSGGNQLTIVADIAARDALLPLTTAKWVYVINATGDTTVTAGGATYLYNPGTTSWVKAAESESMDVVLQWSSITGRPTSAVADIDDAVTKRHAHANLTQLDKIGEDVGGSMTYNGAAVGANWANAAW
jgi:hypothetical protein